jgi:hypothetical protein
VINRGGSPELAVGRPEEVRRHRLRGEGAPGGPHARVELPSSAGGGLGWPDYAHGVHGDHGAGGHVPQRRREAEKGRGSSRGLVRFHGKRQLGSQWPEVAMPR